jgi:hypothetical protein
MSPQRWRPREAPLPAAPASLTSCSQLWEPTATNTPPWVRRFKPACGVWLCEQRPHAQPAPFLRVARSRVGGNTPRRPRPVALRSAVAWPSTVCTVATQLAAALSKLPGGSGPAQPSRCASSSCQCAQGQTTDCPPCRCQRARSSCCGCQRRVVRGKGCVVHSTSWEVRRRCLQRPCAPAQQGRRRGSHADTCVCGTYPGAATTHCCDAVLVHDGQQLNPLPPSPPGAGEAPRGDRQRQGGCPAHRVHHVASGSPGGGAWQADAHGAGAQLLIRGRCELQPPSDWRGAQ